MRALKALGLAVAAALMTSGGSLAQTSTFDPVETTYCVVVAQDAFDYTDEPAALMEALLAGDVTISSVSDPADCAPEVYQPTEMPGVWSYDDWNDHVVSKSKELLELAKRLQNDPDIRGSLVELRDWLDDERRDVKDITPDPCYEGEYRKWTKGLNITRDGVVKVIRAYDRLSLRSMKQATERALGGIELLAAVGNSWSEACE